MDQLTRNSNILAKYIPAATVPLIAEWIYHFNFKLKIKHARSTRYGDYHPPINGKNHTITINNDLNSYAFLMTLVHEIAHLLCFERFGNRVKPHGEEWKECYRELMRPIMRLGVFPEDLVEPIIAHMKDPDASTASDPKLLRALKCHDAPDGTVLLETLPAEGEFIYEEKVFIKGPRVRTRYRCILKGTAHVYFFHPIAEVKAVSGND